jgi:integrase
MAKMKKIDRGLYRIENKDSSVSWMIDYLNPDKKRIRKTYGTKKQAQEELNKRRALMADGEYSEFVEKRQTQTKTFGELVELYKDTYKNQTSFKTAKRFFVEKFKDNFGKDTLLSEIGYPEIKQYRNNLMNAKNQHDQKIKSSSVNREISCLRQMFNEAVEKKWLDRSPFEYGKSLHLKENNKRECWLEPEEARKLFKECPVHLQHIIECVLYTGMRRKEVLNLKWQQIRGDWIYLGVDTKTGNPVTLPIGVPLKRLFERLRGPSGEKSSNVVDMKGEAVRQSQKRKGHIFLFKGQPVKDVKTALKAACERAGIPYGRNRPNGITFHDLRHSFGSLLQQTQRDIRITQQLMNHKSIQMTERYTHSRTQAKMDAVNSIDWGLHNEKSPVSVNVS